MSGLSKRALDAMTSPQLARVWCALNRFERPPELAEYFPANWDTMTGKAQHQFIRPFMYQIVRFIGLHDCLLEWNRDRMTEEEFEEWWRANLWIGEAYKGAGL